jgi:hypothetical protein
MRYLMMVMGNRDYEAGRPASPALYEAMDEFMAKIAGSGALVSAGGLKPSAAGVRLNARDGRIAIMDGPFTEAKEIIGGYAFVEAPSKAAAIEMATEFIDVHVRCGIRDVDVEIREVVGGTDG